MKLIELAQSGRICMYVIEQTLLSFACWVEGLKLSAFLYSRCSIVDPCMQAAQYLMSQTERERESEHIDS